MQSIFGDSALSAQQKVGCVRVRVRSFGCALACMRVRIVSMTVSSFIHARSNEYRIMYMNVYMFVCVMCFEVSPLWMPMSRL